MVSQAQRENQEAELGENMNNVLPIMQQAENNAISDRLKLAAERIYSDRRIPDAALCQSITDVVTDSEWFRDIATSVLTRNIADLFFGCILFGWQLCEEYRKLKEANQTVFRA